MLQKRFGLAKITEGEITTPGLLKVGEDIEFRNNSFRFLDFEIERDVLFSPLFKEREIKIKESIYLVPNILTMLRNTRDLVDFTIDLRERIGYDKLLYAPGTPPHLFPIMVYLGYDLFDNSIEKMDEYSFLGPGRGIDNFSELMIKQVRIALENGNLRELVESVPNVKAKEILRYLDMKYYHIQERFYPVWSRTLKAVSLDSLFRPDIQRWLERLRERYKKPDWAKYLLLIPCSARKPYSESRSHREMRLYIKSTMHEVILTSPLALVPRELERFYPAQNYDIPVIGHWYEDEKKIIEENLRWYLENNEYEGIVSFLPESMKFLEKLLNEFGVVQIWGKDFENLEKETRKLGYHVPRGKMELENMKSLARFQFGTCEDMLDGAKIKGRYQQINIWKDGKRLFGYNPEKGMLTLTEESAKCLLSEGKYIVEIDDFYPEGDVFAAGINYASEEIREGDEVAIAHKNELRGWGIARMSSWDMVEQRRGKAVKLRGRVKG
ncbi:queuine tRNA-ribosyltransferase [Aciduliprofundum sp. MAR08-339]|uniref:DUF5591 domain-containing protein n=1 Tax=Aciduliprofundum sp. (strain MAR08-339) TaxID=673860 RepID=UPI0002A4BA48|nr:queuine tRNA-ribosyltransferase [Aciduliprofundum sp. MAR08-339]